MNDENEFGLPFSKKISRLEAQSMLDEVNNLLDHPPGDPPLKLPKPKGPIFWNVPDGDGRWMEAVDGDEFKVYSKKEI